jgi:nucleotide-binding universal stress UspA family protein
MKKIIWAIDPFEEKLKSRTELLGCLRTLSHSYPAVVEPVHVLCLPAPDEEEARIDTSSHRLYRSPLAQVQEAAEQSIGATLREIEGIEFLPPRVLIQERASLQMAAQTLLTYATATHACVLVVGTHARAGLDRLFLGSFAETLLLHNHQLPVVTVGPACHPHTGPQRILFPTDFSEDAPEVFSSVLEFAESVHAGITLFHVVPDSIEPLIQSGAFLLSGAWPVFPHLDSSEQERRRKLAHSWEKQAREKKVPLQICFESKNPRTDSIDHIILAKAKQEHSSWIALAAQSGALSSALIGSITRAVVRSAELPVWVYRVPPVPQQADAAAGSKKG